jgi:hypothetical protein
MFDEIIELHMTMDVKANGGQTILDLFDIRPNHVLSSPTMGLGKTGARTLFKPAHQKTNFLSCPYISCLPSWDPLRSDPRFKELLRKSNLLDLK